MSAKEQPRNDVGQFEERPDSLHRKVIGIRLSKRNYPKFLELAEAKGVRPTELARVAVDEYLERNVSD